MIEGLIDYPYLLISMKMWPGYLDNQLESMNTRLYEDNGRAVGMVKGRTWKSWKFSINEFWNNVGCLVSYPTIDLWG